MTIGQGNEDFSLNLRGKSWEELFWNMVLSADTRPNIFLFFFYIRASSIVCTPFGRPSVDNDNPLLRCKMSAKEMWVLFWGKVCVCFCCCPPPIWCSQPRMPSSIFGLLMHDGTFEHVVQRFHFLGDVSWSKRVGVTALQHQNLMFYLHQFVYCT